MCEDQYVEYRYYLVTIYKQLPRSDIGRVSIYICLPTGHMQASSYQLIFLISTIPILARSSKNISTF